MSPTAESFLYIRASLTPPPGALGLLCASPRRADGGTASPFRFPECGTHGHACISPSKMGSAVLRATFLELSVQLSLWWNSCWARLVNAGWLSPKVKSCPAGPRSCRQGHDGLYSGRWLDPSPGDLPAPGGLRGGPSEGVGTEITREAASRGMSTPQAAGVASARHGGRTRRKMTRHGGRGCHGLVGIMPRTS